MKRLRRSACSRAVDTQAILPGLPNEVAMLILVRVPLALHARLRYVSRAWHDSLHPASGSVPSLRHSFHISELWVVMGLVDNTLVIYHPLLQCLSSPLPYPIVEPPHHDVGKDIGKDMVGATGSQIFFREKRKPHVHLCSFDLRSMQSHSKFGPLLCSQGDFSKCALLGDSLYMAQQFKVKRMNLMTKLEETLPNMHVARSYPWCVVLKEKLHVISDQYGQVFSGEIWDPSSESRWRLVPELWPRDIFHANINMYKCPPLVAVMADTLYALSLRRRFKPELMCFDTSTNHWNSVAFLPSLREACKYCYRRESRCIALLGVGNALLVFVRFPCTCKAVIKILSCVPTRSLKCLSWKTSEYLVFPHWPISFCTVRV